MNKAHLINDMVLFANRNDTDKFGKMDLKRICIVLQVVAKAKKSPIVFTSPIEDSGIVDAWLAPNMKDPVIMQAYHPALSNPKDMGKLKCPVTNKETHLDSGLYQLPTAINALFQAPMYDHGVDVVNKLLNPALRETNLGKVVQNIHNNIYNLEELGFVAKSDNKMVYKFRLTIEFDKSILMQCSGKNVFVPTVCERLDVHPTLVQIIKG